MSEFQSTLPGWGATPPLAPSAQVFLVFQSTLPGWGATSVWSVIVDLLHISIHTPRMGSDSQSASDPKALRKYFNPRSPDGERPDTLSNFPFSSIFQSTLPGWGATRVSMWCRSCRTNFNPRSPDGERHFTACAASLRSRFQSTLPGWGATTHGADEKETNIIFQSTLPGWGATAIGFSNSSEYLFQSTLPGWGATIRGLQHFIPLEISIHAPRMGSDAAVGSVCPGFLGISIHAPRMGSDGRTRRPHPRNQLISIHAPRMGSDNASIKDVTSEYNFNPRSPDGERPNSTTDILTN
ncbi:Transposase [Bifidobacterium breve]|nr:Transposase [Bifidobacterium breve]